MSVLQQMKDMLSPLGIYSLDDDSLVMCELRLYASQLEKIHEKLATMLKEIFINTAQDYGIEKTEELFESVRPDLPIEERRNRIRLYLTLNNTNFSRNDIENQLRLAGVFNSFAEDSQNECILFPELIAINDMVDVSKKLNIIESIVPAHLEPDVGISAMCWDEFDSLDLNFGAIDRVNLRFDLFDK